MPERFGLAWLALLPVLLLAGCPLQPEPVEIAGEVQGTTYHIKLVIPQDPPLQPEDLRQVIEQRFGEIDAALSNYRQDSEISRLNQQKTSDWLAISSEIAELIGIARQVHRRSEGCYDLTVKPLFDLWGFSRHQGKVPEQATIDRVLPHLGLDKVEVDPAGPRLRKRDPELAIDLSSIAQGYSVGSVAKLLEDRNVRDYMVEIGGEMKVKGHKPNGEPWRIAVEKPTPFTREVLKILAIRQEGGIAVMTSGTYRNFFEESGRSYSHILDPKTGRPVEHHLLSVTVMHEDPTWADAWSTALLCLGEDRGYRLAEAEGLRALFVYADGTDLRERMTPAMVATAGSETP